MDKQKLFRRIFAASVFLGSVAGFAGMSIGYLDVNLELFLSSTILFTVSYPLMLGITGYWMGKRMVKDLVSNPFDSLMDGMDMTEGEEEDLEG